jgi:mannan endo-1,4-beta-mannosidase
MRQLSLLRSRRLALLLAVPLLAAGALAASPERAAATGPTAPAAVLDYLHGISGNHVISGQHNKEPASQPSAYTAKAHDITGKWPGLWGGDFLFGASDVADRQAETDQAKTEWANGSLVNFTWHVCPPTRGSSCGWDPGTGVEDTLSDAQWSELVTDGTALNTAWKHRLDEIVPYLQQLRDAGVPVLFRPLHEMNQGWAWWGGRPGADGSRRLYQITHDYLASAKGLDNVIWVWNVKDIGGGAAHVADYYPGDDYVDVVSLDAWEQNYPSTEWYDAIRNVAHGKPTALAEVGTIPTPEQLAAQPGWVWFMVWSEYLTDTSYNTPEAVRATYDAPRVLSQDEFTVPGAAPEAGARR